jgi:phospholipase/carboxylesterase
MRSLHTYNIVIKVFLVIVFSVIVCGCEPAGPEVTRIQARVIAPSIDIEPGEQPLGLGGPLLINGTISWRDGTLYIPKIAKQHKQMPLLVWLHGGGGSADDIRHIFPLAEELGVVILAIDSRHNTWDGIDSPFGPDVLFIDAALQHTFERVAIDPQRVALGGLSDGAAYALALGRANGDLFTHLIAVAPGHLNPPSPPVGQPHIYVAHGTRDNVYSVTGSRHFIVPRLKSRGYDVTYHEFDGPHWVPAPVARELLMWFTH